MHVPFKEWSAMFDNIEEIMKKGAVGYMTIPSERPNPRSKKDQRHFTILNKEEVQLFLRKRGWKTLHSGKMDGFTKDNIWSWFIVKLPS